MRPPGSVNFSALPIRFAKTCSSRSRSQYSSTSPSLQSQISDSLCSAASGSFSEHGGHCFLRGDERLIGGLVRRHCAVQLLLRFRGFGLSACDALFHLCRRFRERGVVGRFLMCDMCRSASGCDRLRDVGELLLFRCGSLDDFG